MTLSAYSLAVVATLALMPMLVTSCGQPQQAHLATAIWNGDTNRVASLLKEGVDPNAPARTVRRETPAIDAARFGHVEVLKLLLAHGADPTKQDHEGHDALYHALTSPYSGGSAEGAFVDVVGLLLANGASASGRATQEAVAQLPPSDRRAQLCRAALAKELRDTKTPK